MEILPRRPNKNSRIIRVERHPEADRSLAQRLENPHFCRKSENVVKGVDGQDEEHGGEWVSLM